MRRAMSFVRARAPGVADRLAPLKRRLEGRSPPAGVAVPHSPSREALDAAVADARARLAAAPPRDRGAPAANPELPLADLRILLVIGSLAPGGAERQLVHTATGLRRRGAASCDVLVTDDPGHRHGDYRRALERAGIAPVVAGARCDRRALERFQGEPALRRAAAAIPLALRPRCTELFGEFVARRPHVVHCWLDHTNIWGGVAAALAGVPGIVLATRSLAPTNFPPLFEPWMAPWYLALAERPGVLFSNNSAAGAADYARWLGLPRERFTVILNGVDLDAMPEPGEADVRAFRRSLGLEGLREGSPLLCGVLRLGEEKRPLVFVDVALALLERDPRLHVALVGSGPMERAVRARAASSPCAARLHLLGRRHDVPVILAASSLLLLTSRVEGTPNVLLEAQHFGCPVVTTAAGGAVDAMREGVTGAARPVDDVPALVEACAQIVGDPARVAAMGAAGRDFVRERFGLGRMIDETLVLYRRSLGANDP